MKKHISAFPDDVFLKDILGVSAEEYSSLDVNEPYKRPKSIHSKDIHFSFFRITVASAKSILTRDPLSSGVWKDVRAAFYMLDSIVECLDGNLRLSPNFRKRYRDFSKTGRVGELAQAVTFILAQDVLDYPIVCDFDGFLSTQGIPAMRSDEQTPDYALLFRNGGGKLSLIESKGSCPDKGELLPKSSLKEALAQCKSADKHIRARASYGATRTYGTHVRFAESGDPWNTLVAYCDPEEPTDLGPLNPLAVLQQYYAAWLVLAGHRYYAEKLMRGTLAPRDFESWEVTDLGGTRYITPGMSSEGTLFTPFKAFRSKEMPPMIPSVWAVNAKVMWALANRDMDAFGKLFGQKSDVWTDLERGLIFFRDHTLCRWK